MNAKVTPKPEQQAAVRKNGLFVVKACPGSGKTFTVAARMAKMLLRWPQLHSGIATISFTNVAWQEIEKYLSQVFEIRTPVAYPHFVGTIDSFINRYIFLPFGHLVMSCGRRPELVGPPHDEWEPIGGGWYWANSECYRYLCRLNDFSYDIDGRITNFAPKSHFRRCKSEHRSCKDRKRTFMEAGYSTQLDANYFAMVLLKERPEIARALAFRFPVLMIDEAQDTSQMQMAIVDQLISNGLREVMLIGDPDQAIFEWRTAKPDLFLHKYRLWQDNCAELTNNYRSSRKICEWFSRISSSKEAPQALNAECKDFPLVPQIWTYKEGRCSEVPEHFLSLCRDNDIELGPATVAILARSKDLLHELLGGVTPAKALDPWRDRNSKSVARSRYLFEKGRTVDAFRLLERTVCSIRTQEPFCSEDKKQLVVDQLGLARWRSGVYSLMTLLPSTNLRLGEWKEKANAFLSQRSNFVPGFQIETKKDWGQNRYSEISFDEIFGGKDVRTEQAEYTAGTVHSVKGETFEAVLLCVKRRAGNSQKYANVLQSNIQVNEELRIIYVAVTRPRRILVIAVPDGDVDIWRTKFCASANVDSSSNEPSGEGA